MRPVARRGGWGLAAGPCALLMASALLTACASERSPTYRPIRQPDGVEAGLPDAEIPDAERLDLADAEISNLPRPPSRALWVIVRDDPWQDGLRAQLQPPQRPSSALPSPERQDLDALAAFYAARLKSAGAQALIWWRGPNSASDRLASALLDQGVSLGLVYPLADRAEGGLDTLTADLAWLDARLFERPEVLSVEKGPVLLIPPAPDQLWAALEAAAVSLDRPLGLIAWVDLGGEPHLPPEAEGLCPLDAPSLDDRGEKDRQRLRLAWQRIGQGLDQPWLAFTHPPLNRRLLGEDAPPQDPLTGAWRRALIEARLEVDLQRPVLIVDGLGGWLDDRQLDPVTGDATDHPEALTGGLLYTTYGEDRWQTLTELVTQPALEALPQPALMAPLLLSTEDDVTVLALYSRGDQITLQRTGAGAVRAFVDNRIFVAPPGLRLRYRRDHPGAWMEVIFERDPPIGQPSDDDEADPEAVIELDLSSRAGARIEGVILHHEGADEATHVTVSRPLYVTP